MPFPNEHSARLRDPGDLDPKNGWSRVKDGDLFGGRVKVPKTMAVVRGKIKGKSGPKDPPILQSLRFPTKDWTPAKAKKWLKDNKVKYILFEPAKKKESESQAAEAEPVCLSQPRAFAEGGIEIDREAGIIRNVSIITRGPALGHGFDIDDVMLDQVQKSIASKKRGVKCRLTHASGGFFGGKDGVEVMLGRATNPRREEKQVRGDIVFGKYSDKVPGKGDVREYLMDIAESDPEEIGLSIRFIPDEYEDRKDDEDQTMAPAARLKEVTAVDFVGDPGANPGGLLSEGGGDNEAGISGGQGRPAEKRKDAEMNKLLRMHLEFHGLQAGATDEEALEFIKTLEGQAKVIAEGLAAKAKDEAQIKTEEEPGKAGGPEKTGEPEKQTSGAEVLQAERRRYRQISALAAKYKLGDEFVTEQYLTGATPDEVNTAVLEKLAEKKQPLSIQAGADRSREGLAAGMSDAICLRAGVKLIEIDEATEKAKRDDRGRLTVREPAERAREFRGLSMIEMGRQLLTVAGVPDAMQLSRSQVVKFAVNSRQLAQAYGQTVALAMSTSDFPFILGDSMNKSLRAAYEEGVKTWDKWARRATAPDFKDIKRLALSESPDLVLRAEGGGVVYVTLAEGREVYALAEYVNGIRQTRQSILNDDLDAFSRVPGLQASAAVRKEDDVCYAIVTGNADLADGTALFHALHSNLAAGGDVGAPAVATLNAMRAAMRTQVGPKGDATLNIRPAHLLSPAALEGTVLEVLGSEFVPEATKGHIKNIWAGELVPVIEARLDAVSATAWYGAADYNQVDTVEVCFLEDEPVPQAKTEVDFDTDDVKHVIRHTVAAKAIDFRGLYRNPGV